MIRVVTKGSVWLFDEAHKVYYRFPKTEGPRWSPEGQDWGGPTAGNLQDAVPHEYESFDIVSGWWDYEELHIHFTDSPSIQAPEARIEGDG